MRTLLLVAVLLAVAHCWSYPFPQCYTQSAYHCSATMPAAGAWSYESYCPNKNLWFSGPCSDYASLYSASNGDVGCSGGYLWLEDPLKISAGGACAPLKREVEDQTEQLLERTTYATCPVQGDPAHVVCCPSPKTCHTDSNPALVCY